MDSLLTSMPDSNPDSISVPVTFKSIPAAIQILAGWLWIPILIPILCDTDSDPDLKTDPDIDPDPDLDPDLQRWLVRFKLSSCSCLKKNK